MFIGYRNFLSISTQKRENVVTNTGIFFRNHPIFCLIFTLFSYIFILFHPFHENVVFLCFPVFLELFAHSWIDSYKKFRATIHPPLLVYRSIHSYADKKISWYHYQLMQNKYTFIRFFLTVWNLDVRFFVNATKSFFSQTFRGKQLTLYGNLL